MENIIQSITGKIVDIHERKIFDGRINISNGRILKIEPAENVPEVFIMPGLTDSHIHIESSMITPGAFAAAAVKHGTIAAVSDPHEIANVMGIEGVRFMIEDGGRIPLKFFFGAPSCVPATTSETNGAILGIKETRELLKLPQVKYLSEMMNYPGVIYNDNEVHQKLEAAAEYGKPVDGHAPGLKGEMLQKYVSAGITTDHECSTLEEAIEKIKLGMKIIIREGSAARNLSALKDLYETYPEMIMLCSDDLHPEMLKIRHINKLISSLISEGFDMFDVIRSATVNPAKHYNLDTGLLKPGDPADFIIVDNPGTMNVLETWIDGNIVYDGNKTLFTYNPGKPVNNFHATKIDLKNIEIEAIAPKVKVIKAYEGELLTGEYGWTHHQSDKLKPDLSEDILKIVVKDRYRNSAPSVAFIKGFGLKEGAFASSIAHDSHNIICVGTNDEDIVTAINEIISLKGGLCVSSKGKTESLQLDIAGIMSTKSCDEVAADYQHLSDLVRSLGCPMKAPFMALSFMALLVIPDLKISDKGLFNVKEFQLVSLFS